MRASAAFVLAAAVLLTACGPEAAAPPPDVRPVRTVTIAKRDAGEAISLTGRIEAQDEASLGFRIKGRMIERPINVGDRVTAGQILAKLDPQDELNGLRSAQAQLASAQGRLTQNRNDFDRQDRLMRNGHTTRARLDQAQQALQTAQSEVDDTEARLRIAHDRVGHTELRADASGVITAVGAEPGEVVQAGRRIAQIARQDGRDAVFDVPARVLEQAPGDVAITVRLVENASVTAQGRVREVGAQADPVTRTFKVRVGLDKPPAAMRLGSSVTGTVQLDGAAVIALPASALTTFERQSAVWVVDPATLTVSMRNVDVLRHDPAEVVIDHGLDTGEIVVTAGVQALHPGQKVRLLGSPL